MERAVCALGRPMRRAVPGWDANRPKATGSRRDSGAASIWRRRASGPIAADMARLAFLGLGVMGAPTARHLAAAGHDLTVYNRSPEKAAGWVAEHDGRAARSAAEAADGAEAVIACVGNDADVEEVTLGPA